MNKRVCRDRRRSNTCAYVFMTKSSEYLDLTKGTLAVGLVLKRTNLLDSYFAASLVVICSTAGTW